MSNDVSRFDWMICFIHNLWIAPLGSVIAGYLIFNQIGFAGLIGCAVLIFTMPIQGKFDAFWSFEPAVLTM
jgi:ATP-binding cassette, subfamily C (CFTR/MRP), member 4